MSECFLVTGAHGCIGSWVVHELLADGAPVVALDASTSATRLELLLSLEELAEVVHLEEDIRDTEAVERAISEHGITNVIHLAALQVPACRADPPLSAAVNVLGTVNVFNAARVAAGKVRSVVYASSVAAYDALDEGADTAAMNGQPATLYGVYKRANEGIASVYWSDFGVPSIGLRPHTVYGVARDQGLTSAPTFAMLAAAAGVPFRIGYGGLAQFQYARDVARAFVEASRAAVNGAPVHDLPGRSTAMEEVVEAIVAASPEAAGTISFEASALPFPSTLDTSSLESLTGPLPQTSLNDGVRETIARFRDLLAAGRVAPPA